MYEWRCVLDPHLTVQSPLARAHLRLHLLYLARGQGRQGERPLERGHGHE